jgi:hypothetical protein
MVAEPDTDRLHPVMRATVPRNRLRPGAVVLAWVPYHEDLDCAECSSEHGKIRPAVVVEAGEGDLSCLPCTSATSRDRYPWAYSEIADLTSAGLSRPSGVRLRRVSLPASDCLQVLGLLAAPDLEILLGRI